MPLFISNILLCRIGDIFFVGEKPYTCEYCQKGFSDPSTLTVHKRLHTNENPFMCHLCGKTTKQASNLRSHYKHMHKNDVISGRQIRLNSRVFARYSQQEISMHLQLSGNLVTLLEQGLWVHRQEESEKKQQIESALQTLQPPPVENSPVIVGDFHVYEVKNPPDDIDESDGMDMDDLWNNECDDDNDDYDDDDDDNNEDEIKMSPVDVDIFIQECDETMPIVDTSMPKSNSSNPPPIEISEIGTSLSNVSKTLKRRIRPANTSTNLQFRPKMVEPNTEQNKSKKASRTGDRQEHIDDVQPQIESVFIEHHLSDSMDEPNVEVKKEIDDVTVESSHIDQSDDDYWSCVFDAGFKFDAPNVKEEIDENAARNRNRTETMQQPAIDSSCSGTAELERKTTVKNEVTENDTDAVLLETAMLSNTPSMATITTATAPLTTTTTSSSMNTTDLKFAGNQAPFKYKNITGRCMPCNRKFNDITRHRVEMHSDIDKPFECFDCRKTYKKLEHLRSHMVTHTNERNFICHVCGQAFFLGSELRKHIYNRHQNVRPYGCDQCKKTFKNRHALNKHSVVHSGVKPYVCMVCSERYAALSSLRIHERRHTGAKPFVCTYCGKAFADSSTHRQHVSYRKCSFGCKKKKKNNLTG